MSRGGLLGRLSRPLTTKITRVYLERFLQAHATPKRTLDLGASIGPYAAYFPNRSGVDLEKAPGVEVVADAHALSFRGGSFDVVLATEVLEHLQEPQKAADEMLRVLRPGGTLLLTTRFLFPARRAPRLLPLHATACSIFSGAGSSISGKRQMRSARWRSSPSASRSRPTRWGRAGWGSCGTSWHG
jgi:SAM-dependent methyltransferase